MRTRVMARLHAATGVVPLLAFVGLHLWETAAATGGRDHFAARVTGLGGSASVVALEVALVLAPLVVHAALGMVRAWEGRRAGPQPYPGKGPKNLQWITGGITLVFVGVHLTHTWALKLAGAGPFAAYEALRSDLPRGAYLGLYLVGITALCVHIAQGVGAAAVTWSWARTDGARRAWRIGAGTLAAVLWVVAVHTTSHFATGAGLGLEGAPPGSHGAERLP